MPEISDSDYRQFVAYQQIGTPQEVTKKIGDLETDNKAQRDQIRELKEKLPKDGTVAVTKEQAESLAAYEALGKPDEIKAKVDKVPELEGQIAKRDREAARDKAAKALGIEGSDLTFAGADALEYLVKDEEVEANGKKEKKTVAYVKDSEGKEHKLADYGKATWGRGFEALLTAPTAPTNGTRYTPMTGGSGTPAGAPDPAEAGKKMAEEAKKATSDQSLAFR